VFHLAGDSKLEIKPNKKLLTKQWYILITISILVLLVGVILQITIPLSPKVSANEVVGILWPIILAIIVLLWLIAVPVITLWIKNLTYYIEEDRITIHKGILSKIKQNVPYRAITDFQLHRSLYDRFLGIASIKVQTAGQSPGATGYEAKLSGLIDWDELLDQLRIKVKKLYPSSDISETQVVAESDRNILNEILSEVKAIRKQLEAK